MPPVANVTPRRPLRSAILFLAVLLAGCATAPRANVDPILDKNAARPDMPDKILVRDDSDPILSLKLSDDMFVPTPLELSDPLPDQMVNNFSALNATATEAFRLLMLDRQVAIASDPSADEVKVNITNYSGKLQDIAERISETAGVFYTYRNGLLRVSKDRSFIMSLPPIEAALEEMANMITALGAEDAKLDKSSRMVTFRADRRAFDNILSYMQRLRNQKVMLVYETYFLEVSLNDSNTIGINWAQVTTRGTGTSTGTGTGTGTTGSSTTNSTISSLQENSTLLANRAFGNGTPALNIVSSGAGMAFGTLFTSGSLNMNVLFDFLSQQGNVETLSRPTITMMSGAKSKFEVGRKIRFVSRRGVATTEGVSTTQATFETEDLSTGLKVEVSGDYSDDTVFTNIKLSVDDLIRFTDPAPNTANSIQLPETATRALETGVRVRPGDAILIAGINQTRDSRTNSGPFNFDGFMPFLRSRAEAVDRSELVIVLKPRVVRFKRDEMTASELAEARHAEKPDLSAPIPPTTDAVNNNNKPFVKPEPVVATPLATPVVPAAPATFVAPIVPPVNAAAAPITPTPSPTPLLGPDWSKMPAPALNAGSIERPLDRPIDRNFARPLTLSPTANPPSLADQAPLPPLGATMDPMVDSFGYYGRGGVRQ